MDVAKHPPTRRMHNMIVSIDKSGVHDASVGIHLLPRIKALC